MKSIPEKDGSDGEWTWRWVTGPDGTRVRKRVRRLIVSNGTGRRLHGPPLEDVDDPDSTSEGE